MFKRVASLFLWFYAGWTFGALIAFATGGSEAIGPILGAAAAALFAGDPRGLIWRRTGVARSSTATPRTVAQSSQTTA
jgi:hypothetical protein